MTLDQYCKSNLVYLSPLYEIPTKHGVALVREDQFTIKKMDAYFSQMNDGGWRSSFYLNG